MFNETQYFIRIPKILEVQYVDYKKYYFVKPNTFNLYSYYGHRKFKSCVASVNFYAKPQWSGKKQLVIFQQLYIYAFEFICYEN